MRIWTAIYPLGSQSSYRTTSDGFTVRDEVRALTISRMDGPITTDRRCRKRPRKYSKRIASRCSYEYEHKPVWTVARLGRQVIVIKEASMALPYLMKHLPKSASFLISIGARPT